nr:MAG TPA: hypothetical protein [Crassvirales sp.]
MCLGIIVIAHLVVCIVTHTTMVTRCLTTITKMEH